MAVVRLNILSTIMLKNVKLSYGNVRFQLATLEVFQARNLCSYTRTTKTRNRKEIVKNAQRFRYLTVSHMPSIISSGTASKFSDKTAAFGGPSLNSLLSELRPRLNSLNQFFTLL